MLDEAVEAARLDLAQHRHTPTPAMIAVAKRGIRKAQGRDGVDPAALSVARRVASGQKLGDEHVEGMASYNASLDSTPDEDSDEGVESMLWGGAPGASWSNARVAAMDTSELADSVMPTLLNLDEDGKSFSLEVFVRDGLGEPATVEADGGLIWAPILRSGMLAMRPGPNGEKVHEPLVFVPGKASDPRKEIGLQNLLDNFNAGAIQHVTIPTTHENDVLSNTGFIKAMKIVPSTKRPGEMVLAAGHDFRNPDVRKQIELGTIANRSCGIVYDYVDTDTGVKYDQVVDHVALTNRPWVRGMTAYGDAQSEDDFSGREVVPVLLSEQVVGLAQPSTDAWDPTPARFSDAQWTRSCVVDSGEGAPKDRYSEPIREPDGTLNANAVHIASKRLKGKSIGLAQKKAAARTLVSAHRQLNEDAPDDLRHIVASSTNMSEAERREILLADVQWGAGMLSMNSMNDQVVASLAQFGDADEVYPIWSVMDVVAAPEPKALVRVNYGDPAGVNDAWVIPLEVDGDKVSLSDFAQWTPVQKEWVVDDDAAQDKSEVASILGLSDSTVTNPTPEGGAVPAPTIQEAIQRLGLSEDQKSVFDTMLADNARLKAQVADVTKDARETAVRNRVAELQGLKFSPGFCRLYEEIALGDDGQVAATLNLSENGQATGAQPYTATQIAEKLIGALPKDDSGALALADRGGLGTVTSPLTSRPPLTAADQAAQEAKDKGAVVKDSLGWLKDAYKQSPQLGAQLAEQYGVPVEKLQEA
jgi:hypothetical protein